MKCRNCKATIGENTSVGDKKAIPQEGDYSLCLYCGAISRFDSDLNLLPISPEDLVTLNNDDPLLFDELMKIRSAINTLPTYPHPIHK